MNKEEKHSNKCPFCGRPTHKGSEYCIFHAGTEEKTEDEFIEAIKEYIQKIKEEDKNYNFERFIFIGDINFKKDINITIFKNADFTGTTFKGDAYFIGTTFKGDAYFIGTIFKGYTNFTGTTFKGDAYFIGTTFKGYAGFGHTTFKGDANFTSTTFKGYAGFGGATFERGTYFGDITFKGDAYFEGATFEGDASFEETTFEGDADFLVKSFVKNVTFAKVSVLPGKKLNLKVKNNKGNVSFERAYLENIYLELHLGADVLIDFTNTLLRNTEIERDQIENHILQEEKKEFFKAKRIYLLLKNNFHSIGKYEDESWAFKKEKDIERLSQSFSYYIVDLKNKGKKENFPILKWIRKGNFRKWIISAFSNIIFGYGERPWNVVKTSVVIIIIFALSFSLIGIGKTEIIELKGTGIYQNSGDIVDLAIKGFFENSEIRNFPDSLYFSLITFTTLGYGDFRPLEGLGRILAGSEAFLGAIMMALFVYTFARRTGGR